MANRKKNPEDVKSELVGMRVDQSLSGKLARLANAWDMTTATVSRMIIVSHIDEYLATLKPSIADESLTKVVAILEKSKDPEAAALATEIAAALAARR